MSDTIDVIVIASDFADGGSYSDIAGPAPEQGPREDRKPGGDYSIIWDLFKN